MSTVLGVEGDADVSTSCPQCGAEQSLDRAALIETDPLETVYLCENGCGPILIVSTRGVIPWEGRGYRMGDWAIRNPSDLVIRRPGAEASVLMPASPHALD